MLLATSDITREVDHAMLVFCLVSLVILVGITAAMIWFAARYSRGRARRTVQIEGHKWLEITWIVIPTLIVTWLFFVGYKGFALMRDVPADAMVVEVTGKQWVWTFHYPEEKVDASEMVVPLGKPVKVELTAPPNDVVHSFFIPDFRVKEDAVPGKSTYLWFDTERTGTYNIFCAEFCGKDHSQMISFLHVVPQEEYDNWIRAQRAKRYQPLVFEAVVNPEHETFGPEGLKIDSQVLFKVFCASCHGEAGDGSGLPGVARNFTSPDGWKRSTKVVDIYRTLTEGVEGTQMRAYPNLTPWERVALAHYVRHFLPQKPPDDAPEDYAALVAEYELDKIKPPGERISIDQAIEILDRESGEEAEPRP